MLAKVMSTTSRVQMHSAFSYICVNISAVRGNN